MKEQSDYETESDENDEHYSRNLGSQLFLHLKNTEFVVFKWCNGEIEIEEQLAACDGLGTKLFFLF